MMTKILISYYKCHILSYNYYYDEKFSFSHIRHNVLFPSQEAGYIRFEDENLTTVEEFQESVDVVQLTKKKVAEFYGSWLYKTRNITW